MERERLRHKRFGQLKCAILEGQRGIIESLLNEDTPVDNPHDREKDFRSPLHSSIYLGDAETVKRLLDRGASVNVLNENNETALTLAAKFEKYDIVDLLLSDKRLKNCANRENFTHLHIACMRNRVDVVEKLLEHKVDVNTAVKSDAFRWSGYTPLHFAVRSKSIETVAFLLKVGADITIKNSKQLTALHLADMTRDNQMIDMILMAHKYVAQNPMNPVGLSHFHIACTRNNKEIVECFIRSGVEIDKKIIDSSSNWPKFAAIDFAIYYNCIDVVKLLLQEGNRKILPSGGKVDRVQEAHLTGNIELVELILHRDELTKDKSSRIQKLPTLHYSCIVENTADVRDALSEVPHLLNTPMWQGSTPLHLAIERGNSRTIMYLLEQGADYNIKNIDGKSPLHLAFERNMKPIVNSFLEKLDCIKENPTDSDGFSHFHIACIENNVPAVAKFMKLAVDVNQSVNFDSVIWPGFTPLHLAAKFEATEVARILLEHSASYSATNYNDLTALDEAVLGLEDVYENNDGVFDIMRAILSAHLKHKIESFDDRGFSLLHLLHNDPLNDTRDMKEFILEHQADINKAIKFPGSPWDGFTPLHFAMAVGDEEEHIKLLVEMGADLCSISATGDHPHHLAFYSFTIPEAPMTILDFEKMKHNPVGSQGHSLFHVACAAGNLEWIKYFLDYGIDPNIRTTSYTCEFGDRTPLHVATRTQTSSKLEVVKLLLDNGADVNLKDDHLNTPLHEMIGFVEDEVIDVLIGHGLDVNSRNAFLRTPLLSMCTNDIWFSDEQLVQKVVKLLNQGADINLEDESGITPLSVDIWENRTDYSSVEVLVKHVKKLLALGLHVSEENIDAHESLMRRGSFDSRSRILRYFVQCKEELDIVKKIRLNAHTLLHDVLFKDLNGLSVMTENDEFQRIVNSDDFGEKYPIYGPMLKLQLKRGTERRQLMTEAEKSFKSLTDVSVPRECWERILQSLSNDDLNNISICNNQL